MDFHTITACGGCCVDCLKKNSGICREFPCERRTSVIHWNLNIVEHLSELAKKYREQETNQAHDKGE